MLYGNEGGKEFLKPKILLVEDDELNSKIIDRILEKRGLKCDAAFNGVDAFNLYVQKEHDLVLMDCQIPLMDGYECTKKIRSHDGNSKHTVIIAITAGIMEQERIKCLESGMDDYLIKPISANSLYDKIYKFFMSDSFYHSVYDKIITFMNESGLSEKETMDIFHEYYRNIDIYSQKIEAALLYRNFQDLKSVTHQFKGVSGNLRLTEIYSLACELEKAAAENLYDSCKSLVQELKKLVTK